MAGSLFARGVRWAMRHPTTTLGGLGAAGGFIGSGGSGWGALLGGGLGLMGGREGFNKGWGKAARTEGSILNRSASWISKVAPEASLATRMGKKGLAGMSRAEGRTMGNVFRQAELRNMGKANSYQSAVVKAATAHNIGARATNIGARNISKVGLRGGGMLAAGLGIGIGTSVVSSTLGGSYGSTRKTRFGAVFSGFGNAGSTVASF